MTNTNKIPNMPTVIEVDGVEYDLTKLDQPFGDLPMDVRIEVFRWYQLGGGLEAYYEAVRRWCNVEYPSFNKIAYTRISMPCIEPEYPWHLLDDWVQYCAIDGNGRPWGFENKPEKTEHGFFITIDKKHAELSAIKFERGNLHWTETLRKRPEGV